MQSRYLNITTVTDNINVARKISRTLVEKDLIAGAQIEQIESIYMWQGHKTEKTEYRIIFKTTTEKKADVYKTIKELHNYKCPEITGQYFDFIDKDFAAWIENPKNS